MTSFICYSSPETLVNNITIQFIQKMVENKQLNLFCINNIYLFIKFGISFRQILQTLKSKIISIFNKEDSSMKIPVLLMTATFDLNMFSIIQRMLGLYLYSTNVFWTEASYFQKRHINIKMKYSL